MQAERALFGETEQAGSEKGFANPLNLGEAIKSREKKASREKQIRSQRGKNCCDLEFENWKETHLVLGFRERVRERCA